MRSALIGMDFIKSFIKKIKLTMIPDKLAMLVLVWNLLLEFSIESYSDYAGYCLNLDCSVHKEILNLFYIQMSGFFIFLMTGLFSVWLVGWKYRLVDIVFTGIIILGVAFLVLATHHIVTSGTNKHNRLETVIVMILYYSITNIGNALVLTSLFQLAIEQIPDASSSQLSSLTSWYIFSGMFGYWFYNIVNAIFRCYLDLHSESAQNYLAYFTLAHGTILTFILASYALIKYKLVDNSPTSNTVSHIYQVVKYAIKHKRPVQRSAMTYWEEEIPRGMDLGKRKYGGPFTSEKVEDVKTFFRLSFLFLIALFYFTSFNLSKYSLHFVDLQTAVYNHSFIFVDIFDNFCTESIMYNVFGNYLLWILIGIVVYEAIKKTLLHYKISDVRWRLKFGIVVTFLAFSVIAIILGIERYSTETYVIYYFWLIAGLCVPIGITTAITFTAGLEFLIAQIPYAMRNFFINVGYNSNFIALHVSRYIYILFNSQCKSRNCPTIYSLASLSVNFVAMLLFWIAITQYRMRSRGQEDEHQQRWVEEVYDRYLEQVDQ